MPKRGIKKRILNKVSALFSIRGAKHRLEIHGEQKDSSSPKQPDKNTIRGVMSSKTPQYKPRGIRFSRRAVQRSKYLRQKFGVRKTVMGFSPRVGSITEEDESEITLWMLADNAENVISEGMAWLTSEDCCEDSTGMEQEDHEKILQMWIQSNSFDDKDIYHHDDCDSSSFSEDDDDDDGDDDGEDDNNDDEEEHQNEIIKDYNSTRGEDDDVTKAAYDTGTESDDEDEGDDENDDDDDEMDDNDDDDANDNDQTVNNNENTGDSLNEINCSIYIDDESFDELDDYDDEDNDNDGDNDDDGGGGGDDQRDDSYKQLEPAIETKIIVNNLTRESNIAVLDSANSQGYNNIFDSSTDGNNDINMCEQTRCKEKREKISGFEEEVDVESELTHDKDSTVHVLDSRYDNDDDDHDSDDNNLDINQNDHTFSACNGRFSSKDAIKNNTAQADLDIDVKTQHEQTILSEKVDQITPDDDVINTVKEEIDEILSRISQIESDFNFMRKSMNEFRSSDVQNNDTIQ